VLSTSSDPRAELSSASQRMSAWHKSHLAANVYPISFSSAWASLLSNVSLVNMLSRLLNSTLEKLSITDHLPSAPPEFPTLTFPLPPPEGTGTPSLCSRCLTLLSHVVTQYGDGTGYQGLTILHSSSLIDPFEASQRTTRLKGQNNKDSSSGSSKILPSCVICTRTLILFNAARAHVSFEKSLRKTPTNDWSLTWRIDAPDPKRLPQFAFPHASVSVLMTVDHEGGYGWGIGKYIEISLKNPL